MDLAQGNRVVLLMLSGHDLVPTFRDQVPLQRTYGSHTEVPQGGSVIGPRRHGDAGDRESVWKRQNGSRTNCRLARPNRQTLPRQGSPQVIGRTLWLVASLVGLALVLYFTIATLTVVGGCRRGEAGWVAALGGAMFLVAWVVWYVRDVLRPAHRRS